MRFVALVSGGKDSIYCILESLRNGHELVACVHLGRPESVQEESYMYQTAASEVVRTLVEECLGVPLLLYQRVGTSVNTSLIYDDTSAGGGGGGGSDDHDNNTSKKQDEVEDLFLALQQAKEQFENVEAVASGAILSTYQRVRIEHVCGRLGLTSLSYLWRLLPQKDLLQKMLEDGIEAVVVRAACPPGLVPRKHLNKTLRFLWDTGLMERLHQRYQFHVCGEGGEYESLVIDSPLHKKKLVFDQVEIDETDDGVGDLRIVRCHAEDKTDEDIPLLLFDNLSNSVATKVQPIPTTAQPPKEEAAINNKAPTIVQLPHVQIGTGGLLHVSEIMASVTAAAAADDDDDASDSMGEKSESDLAVQEALEVLSILKKTLERHGSTAQDVMFVHLYLSEISHFANINAQYQAFFGTLLPPSRSCVAVGKGMLPGGRRVLLDCMIQRGSGEYMRTLGEGASASNNTFASTAHATKTSKLRDVLHVQSISHWAPVCVGPYSQVNTLRSGLHFLAGQIGLVPATMQLQPTWNLQLDQCWKNVAAVLDALRGVSLKHLVSGMIYVSHTVHAEAGSLATIEALTTKRLNDNGSIVAGRIDSLIDESELYGGYEDQGTWEEMKSELDADEEENNTCPILVVCIPEMPKGAAVEVEVITATDSAFKHLEMKETNLSLATTTSSTSTKLEMGWDTGHAFAGCNRSMNEHIQVNASVRALGHQNAAVALVSASTEAAHQELNISMDSLLQDMLTALSKVLSEGRSGLGAPNTIHIRLFQTATRTVPDGTVEVREDGLQTRVALQRAIGQWATGTTVPAATVVPVHSINIINSKNAVNDESTYTFLTLQAFLVDPVHLETNIWISKDREYTTSLDL